MNTKSILIIDDDEFAIEALTGAFQSLGISNILTASDGQQALKLLARLDRAPDYLMCDVFMPNMDGIEFLTQLGTMGFKGGVMIVSGGDPSMLRLTKLVSQAKALRVLGTFLKPMSRDELSIALASDQGQP